jgi:diaminohydroxyphosphoribosylaminopyrimidine deaminase/5-amino-6-(5-phosphoribosylamino)uracil reductase
VNDEAAMSLALAEAVKALGRTHPNPSVGAVIVKGKKVIAAGYTSPAGGPHAEAVALKKAGARAKGATLYSTLEPCNHFGRTPPCTEAIIAAGIKRVVFASTDPNPLVNGKGVRRLRAAGIEVKGQVLSGAAELLNQPFFKVMRTGLPFVTAKAGLTLDGKIATSARKPGWITSDASRRVVHQLRDMVDAILVGATTVIEDDPQLTTRLARGRSPLRVVLDARLRTNPRSKVYDTRTARTAIATLVSPDAPRARAFIKRGVEIWRLPAARRRVDLVALMQRLVKSGALHLLVEGGAEVHAAFLQAGLVDEVMLFMAPKLFGHAGLTWSGPLGVKDPAKALQLESLEAQRVGDDLLISARVASSRATRSPR